MNAFLNKELLDRLFLKIEINDDDKFNIQKSMENNIPDTIDFIVTHLRDVTSIKEKLSVIFEYEKHYLDLIKEYKEEIKFANTLQEDLRRERTQFFSQHLKEAAESLKESQVDKEVASLWIQELVQSYTNSLNISQGLANAKVIETIDKLKQKAADVISTVDFSEE